MASVVSSPNVFAALMAAFALLGGLSHPRRKDASTVAREALRRFRAIDWSARRSRVGAPDPGGYAWKTRLQVRQTLAALGPEAALVLRRALGDDDPDVRALAASVLGLRGDSEASLLLERIALSDTDEAARVAALDALGIVAGASTRQVIARVRAADPDAFVRDAASCVGAALDDPTSRILPWEPPIAPIAFERMDVARMNERAPDFRLPDGRGVEVALSDFRGKQPVVLLFVLGDW